MAGMVAEVMADLGWKIASESNLPPTRPSSGSSGSTGSAGETQRRSYSTRAAPSQTVLSHLSRPLSTEAHSHAAGEDGDKPRKLQVKIKGKGIIDWIQTHKRLKGKLIKLQVKVKGKGITDWIQAFEF